MKICRIRRESFNCGECDQENAQVDEEKHLDSLLSTRNYSAISITHTIGRRHDEYPFQTNYSMALSLLPSLLAWMLSMLFLWLAMTLIAFCRQGPSFSQCFLNTYEAQLLTKHNSVSLRERLPNGSPCPLITTGRARERGLGGRSTSFSLSIALIFNRVRIRRRDAAEDTGSSNSNIATFAKFMDEP